MAMGSLDMETVSLIPDYLNMSQKVNMPIFHVVDWSLQRYSDPDLLPIPLQNSFRVQVAWDVNLR